MTVHHHYQVYQLQLASDRSLPALPPGVAGRLPDLTWHWNDQRSRQLDNELAWYEESSRLLDDRREAIRLYRAAAPAGEYLRLSVVIDREHRDRTIDIVMSPQIRDVWIRSSPEVKNSDAESILLNLGLGCMLRLRGVVCLHGNTVVIGDRAVTILGPKTAGKSTMAAELIRGGARLLADDIAALTPQGTTTLVEPGYPRLRLWPKSLEGWHHDYADLPLVLTGCPKRSVPVDAGWPSDAESWGGFCPQAMPLAVIYVLGRRDAPDTMPAITPMPPQESMRALAANTYAGYVVTESGRRQEFAALARLASTIPIRRLQRPNDLSRLPELSRLVMADLEEHSA
ncbi:MAG TPA: hypothetical protein VJ302_27150 [Blastocatellia bacterium]|nr:hypothetical protein [Blastocatellia bacterium]